MTNNDAMVALRTQLVAAGIRTIGFSFDGSGDSGSIEEIALPKDPSLSLEDCEDPDAFGRQYWLQAEMKEQFEKHVQTIRSIDTSAKLEDLAYAALEHFNGDWVNNDGGYGVVGIDLLTGQFQIDGWQRVSDVESAYSSGSLGEVEATTPEMDVTRVLRATLGVS